MKLAKFLRAPILKNVCEQLLLVLASSFENFGEFFDDIRSKVRSSCPVAKFTEKHLCQSLFFNKVAGLDCNFSKKETLAQVFSYEFCEISKNTFFYRTPQVAASEGPFIGIAQKRIQNPIFRTPYALS